MFLTVLLSLEQQVSISKQRFERMKLDDPNSKNSKLVVFCRDINSIGRRQMETPITMIFCVLHQSRMSNSSWSGKIEPTSPASYIQNIYHSVKYHVLGTEKDKVLWPDDISGSRVSFQRFVHYILKPLLYL